MSGLATTNNPARCEHCGSTKLILDGCVRCGAPQCCDQCCQITTLEYLLASAKQQRDTAQEGWLEAGTSLTAEAAARQEADAQLAAAHTEIERLRRVLVEAAEEYDDQVKRLAQQRADALSSALDALLAIQRDPYGCPFCDSGTLRDAAKGHTDTCGYALMEQVLREQAHA